MDDVSARPPGTETDRLLMAAARSTHAAQLLVDPSGRLVVASRQAEEDLGVRPEDVGSPLRDLAVVSTPVELEPLLERALETGSSQGVRGVEDDRGRSWDVLVAPLAGLGTAEPGLSITFHDVTAASDATRGLADARALLATALDDLRATGEELESASAALLLAVADAEQRDGAATPVRDQDLQQWTADLRERSADVRRHAARSRARQEATPSQAEELTLGDVPVVDLFVVLVESHRLEVREAVRRLMLGLLEAGYPADADAVSASDAMDILESVLGEA